MRKLFILWLLLAAIPGAKAQLSIYDCNLYEPVSQVDLGPTLIDYHSPCVFLDGTYNFGGNFKKRIRANNSIEVFPGFTSGPFDGLGGMTLELVPAKSDFDVAVMNYTSLSGILKYEKFELGVTPPAAVLEKINNFVGDSASGPKINPYLDWEIRVVGEFMKDGDTIKIDGFYSRDFISNMATSFPTPANVSDINIAWPNYSDEEYHSLGGWTEVSSNHPFRIRFAPPRLGVWDARVKIYVNSTESYESDIFAFKVIESGNPGYLRAHTEGRFLEHNNRTFLPVGCNAPWPVTSDQRDVEFSNYLKYDDHGNWITRNEDYRHFYVVPRVYDKYKEALSAMADNGANYFRTIMYPTCTEIEWEKLGDYTKRLYMAQEMDKILELAEDKDFFLHWDLQIHYSLQFRPAAYWKLWTWEYNTLNNEKYCYRALMENDNPNDDPTLFFTHEEAKKYYKQRLRYILARYGYSTSIGLFELFCEISNVGAPSNDNNSTYLTGNNWQKYRDWHVEMADYLKTQYHGKIHLVTANYVAEKHVLDNTFESSSMDVMTSNFYDFGEPSFANGFWNKKVASTTLNGTCLEPHSYTKRCPGTGDIETIKPMFFSETGAVETENSCDGESVEMNRSMWQGLFSGLAGSLNWNAWNNPSNYGVFRAMRDFTSPLEYLGDENWYPGASNSSTNNPQWTYNNTFGSLMEGVRADVVYLRSLDGNYAVGVITNKTYNIGSISTCFNWTPPTPIRTPTLVHVGNENLFLIMNAAKYDIEYYYPSNLQSPFHMSDAMGTDVKLDVDIPASAGSYIVLFKANRKGYSDLQQAGGSNVAETQQLLEKEESDNGADQTFKVYPIPSFERLIIEGTYDLGPVEVMVISSDGNKINSFPMTNARQEINISNLERGTYFISFMSHGTLLSTKKIIKL